MHDRPDREKNCHSREGGNPRIYGGERKVQLIMFTYLADLYQIRLSYNDYDRNLKHLWITAFAGMTDDPIDGF